MRGALTTLICLLNRQFGVGLLALASLSLHAQDYARLAPKMPLVIGTSAIASPPPAKAPIESRAALGVDVKGIVFLNSVEQVESSGWSASLAGLDASRVPNLNNSSFAAKIEPFMGSHLTMNDLGQIKTTTVNWLRGQKRPFVDVTIPPQNLSNGVIQVVVTEYRLGQIKVKGARYFSESLIRSTSGLQTGQALQLDDIQNDLNRLNRNPFLNVDAVFEPGSAPSQTDVQLKARDQFPLRVYSGFDNLGTRGLGTEEYNAGANWGNVFGTGQIVSYQFTRSVEGSFSSHSISDAIPLQWGDQLLVFGSYAIERPLMGSHIFNDLGHSGQASLRYVRMLPHFHRLTQQIEGGYDFKTTDNNLEFAGFHVFGTQAEVDQFPLIYDGSIADRYGQTAIQNTFVYSPGRITAGNTTEALATLVPGSRAAYFYNRFTVTRTTPLANGFSAITRVTAQESDHNLPYSEQLGGGGVGSVRGYYTDTAFGSNGELYSQELRLPSFVGSKLLDHGSRLGDKAQLGFFFDFANLRQVTAIPDLQSNVDLASAGFLARYATDRFFDVEFDLGRRLMAAPTVPQVGFYGQISLTGRF